MGIKKLKVKDNTAAKEVVKNTTEKTPEKTVKESAPETQAPVDAARVREKITNLVNSSAEAITLGVIEAAKTGQLATAKYLFEVAGLYPATEETSGKPEDSLAYMLLKRMGLPTEPITSEEDPALLAADVQPATSEPANAEGEDSMRYKEPYASGADE